LAASLSHSRTVYVISADVIEGRPTIAMEYVMGGTLQDRLDREGTLPPNQAVEAALDIIEGLEAAHEMGIVHRDVKPSNCFVEGDGRIKIGDFGISKSLDGDLNLTQTGGIVGTPVFASPEQLRGQPTDLRSDMYGLGATLYALLTGEPPFQATNVGDLLARAVTETPRGLYRYKLGIPARLRKIVMRLLAKNPAKRYQNYASLRAALLPFSERGATPATQGRRVLAFIVDLMALTTVQFLGVGAVAWIWKLDFVAFLESVSEPEQINGTIPWSYLAAVGGYLATCGLFGLWEWAWGATPGKASLGIRVESIDGRKGSASQIAIRSLIYFAPAYLIGLISPPFMIFGYLVVCLSMRRSNGHAGLHELASGTRVTHAKLRRKKSARSKSLTRPHVESVMLANPEYRGPYALLRESWQTDSEALYIAFDQKLRRQVWVFESQSECATSDRPSHLHWLMSGDHEGRTWHAFEAPTGQSLIDHSAGLVAGDWSFAREILLQLLDELVTGAEAEDLPSKMSLAHLWIDAGGQLKLLPFPSYSDASTFRNNFDELRDLVRHAASTLLTPQAESDTTDLNHPTTPRTPLPQHARVFLNQLWRRDEAVPRLVERLRKLSTRPINVTTSQRMRHVFYTYGIFMFILLLATALTPEIMVSVLRYFIGPFAVICTVMAFTCPGGPSMNLFGMTLQDRNGAMVTRIKSGFRALLAWSPMLIIASLAWLPIFAGTNGMVYWLYLMLIIAIALSVYQVTSRPARGIQDLIAGTWVVRH
jgi:uncharacterized RDD family membrane protein YckC